MKKSLLLTLVSLLVFGSTAYADYKFIYPKDVTLASTLGDHKTIEFGGTADITAFACSLKTQIAGTRFNMSIGSTYEGTDLYEGNPGGRKTTKIYHSKVVTCSTSTIYFKNTVGCAGRECSNMVFTIATNKISFNSQAVGTTSETQPFNIFASSKPTLVCPDGFTCLVGSPTNYCYPVTVTFSPTEIKDYNGNITMNGQVVAKVSGTGSLSAPTLSNTAKGYTTANLSWNSISGATGYRLYNNGSKFGDDIPSTQTSIHLEELALHTTYNFTITTLSGSSESTPSKTVIVTTNDLAASASITVSNPSYSSVEAQWAAIPDATGYKIVSNNGVVNVFDGHDVTSGTLVGLMPNNTYTFTIYGMYGEEVSLNGKTSTAIGTKETKCPIENNFGEKEIESKGGFNWDDKYSATITTTKNQATVSFSFKTSSGAATGSEFFVQESADGSNWAKVEGWSSSSQSGSGQVTLSRGKFKFRFVYSGNFGATISNISAMQGSYFEVPETEIDFGNVGIGEKPTKNIAVNYSTMVGNVSVSKEISDKFSIDKNQVGEDKCGYGSENIKVTFDGSEIGSYEGTITVGSVNVKVKATVTLPVPTLSASEITYTSAKLSWNAVEGAEKYKLNLIGGNSIETTETSYVCKTLKLHSSNQFTVQAYGGGQYTDPSNVVTVNTNDLAAPQNFKVEEVSYTSIPTVWDAVEDATGYRIQNETLGTYEDIDNKTTAYLFAALNANTTYTISVTPIYNGELSNNKASLTVTTKETPYIPVSDCEQFRDVSEKSMEAFLIGKSTDYNFGKAIYKSNVSFKAKASKGALLNTDLYAQVNGQWQKIWDESDAEITSSYKTFTATVPDGATAIRFYNNTGSSMWRNYSEVIVKRRNELTPSTTLLQFGDILLGSTDTKTITVDYSNLSDMTVLSEGSNVFKVEIPEKKACEYGTIECKVSYSPVTLDKTQQGTLTIFNGITKGIAIEGGVKPLPATNAAAAATGKSAVSVQWNKVAGATGYKITCDAASIDVTIPDTGSEHYSYNATGLDENTQYTFTITTLYNAIENESASASATTYSTVKVEKAGAFAETTTFTLSGVEGQWNKDENSFASGSTATINASNSNVCAKFDKLTIGETEYTTLPQAFIVNAPATATIYYTAKELDAPVVTVNCGSKNSAELNWSAVECADSYTVYVNGVEAETGITSTSYTATDLTPATDYTFVVKAVSGSLETASESATATTYGVIKVQVGGDATSTTDWTLTGEAGKWNETEESFEVGSNVSVLASNSDAGVIFDKIQYYGGESTVNPTSITVLNASVAETWAGIYYKYNGVVELNGKVYNSLDEAAEAAMAEDGQMNLLQDVPDQSLNVNSYVKFNGNGHDIGNLYIKENGDLEIVGDVQVVNDFGLEVTADHSGQFADADKKLTVLGRAYIDKTLDPSGMPNENKWYAVSVPFNVKSSDVYALVEGIENSMSYYSEYVFSRFDGSKHASTGKGWVRWTSGGFTLEPGQFYLFATANSTNTYRFVADGVNIISDMLSITLHEYPSSKPTLSGWNGIGNTQLFHSGVEAESTFAQVYINGENRYLTVDLSETALGVTSPMFIQQGAGMSPIATLDRKNDGTLRSTENYQSSIFNIQIKASGTDKVADQLFVKTTTNRSNEYTIGSDLMKFEISSTSPQIYTKAFDTNLSVYEALTVNKQTDIPLYLYAPKSGNYILSLGKAVSDDVNLYLVKNGAPIHNFTEDGSIEIAITKGTATEYSLRIEKSNDIATNADENNNAPILYVENGNTLVISNLADGKIYRIGNLSAEYKSYVSNGETIRMTFIQKGTYWIEIDKTITKFEITK